MSGRSSRFVADFVGSSNVLAPDFVASMAGSARWASLRPEKIALLAAERHARADAHADEGRVAQIIYHGAVTGSACEAERRRLLLDVPARRGHRRRRATRCRADLPPDALHLMEPDMASRPRGHVPPTAAASSARSPTLFCARRELLTAPAAAAAAAVARHRLSRLAVRAAAAELLLARRLLRRHRPPVHARDL